MCAVSGWLGSFLVAVIALLPFSFHAERHLETATRVEGSQAETVRQELPPDSIRRLSTACAGGSGVAAGGFAGGRAGASHHRGGTERPTRRVRRGVLPRPARSDLSGQGRRDVCPDGARVDRRACGVAGSRAARAGDAPREPIARPLSHREAGTHRRDSAEFRHSQGERRRRATAARAWSFPPPSLFC